MKERNWKRRVEEWLDDLEMELKEYMICRIRLCPGV